MCMHMTSRPVRCRVQRWSIATWYTLVYPLKHIVYPFITQKLIRSHMKRLTARQGGCTSRQQQYSMQCREADPNQSELYRLSCSTFHHHSLHSSTSHSRDTLQAFERNALTQKFVDFDSHSGLGSTTLQEAPLYHISITVSTVLYIKFQ